MLKTNRLEIIPVDLELMDSLIHQKEEFIQKYHLNLEPNWPDLGVYRFFFRLLKEDPSLKGHIVWLIVDKASKTIIGDIGFKGKPNEDGNVEIGYSVIPKYQNKGYAKEACEKMIEYAFQNEAIKGILAETFQNNMYSIKVLEHFDFKKIDEYTSSEGHLYVWKKMKNN